MHARAWHIIERFFRSDEGFVLAAPTAEELRTFQRLYPVDVELVRASLDTEIKMHLTNRQHLHAQSIDERCACVSERGVAQMLLLCMRFLRVMVNYPFSYDQDEARDAVCSTSRAIFTSAWRLASGEIASERTAELHALVAIRCLGLLKQYTESQTLDIEARDCLAGDMAIGRKAVMGLSSSLRMGSSSFRKVQQFLFTG
jgi:hypothetical protein